MSENSRNANKRPSSLQDIDDFLGAVGKLPLQKERQVSLKVLPGPEAEHEHDDRIIMVKMQPPEGTRRLPADIACAIDISGSMDAEATIIGAGGSRESHGLSLLDVAKHGVRTVINTLGEGDRLALIAFDHRCQSIFGLTFMDAAGRKFADARLDALRPAGGTDIWLGMEGALDALRAGRIGEDGKGRGSFAHLILLTDGKTLRKDKIMERFAAYKEKSDAVPSTVGTFGFGYNIDSDLLCDLAREGNGGYAFIPDAGFVGTVFVNAVSNLLTTMARDVRLTLKAESGAEIQEVLGYQQVKVIEDPEIKIGKRERARRSIASWTRARQVSMHGNLCEIALGTLQFGQSTDVVLRMRMPNDSEAAYLSASLNFSLEYDGQSVNIGPVKGELHSSAEDAVEVEAQRCRCRFVETVRKAMAAAEDGFEASIASGRKMMEDLNAEILASPAADTEGVKALLEDVNGQSTEALSRKDWYAKWGAHYLASIMFAHRMQQCNNFKDPGVQVYGGRLFQDICDAADEEFNGLPPPKPTCARAGNHSPFGGTGGYHSQAAPVNMAAYNDRYAGCVDGSSPVRMANGEARCLQDLVKGERVMTIGDAVAEVLCLVRTRCVNGQSALVELPGGLRITPYHPVLVDGTWRFPIDLTAARERPCEAIYSIVLRGAPAVVIGDFPCIAWGHGIEDGAARHPYFGSQRAIDDISRLPGFDAGLVDLDLGRAIRDPITGMVSRLLSE